MVLICSIIDHAGFVSSTVDKPFGNWDPCAYELPACQSQGLTGLPRRAHLPMRARQSRNTRSSSMADRLID